MPPASSDQSKRLSVVGSGYVGTTIAGCFADLDHEIVNVDVDEAVVDAINAGEAPIHEEGLSDLLAAHAGPDGSGALRATTDYGAIAETDASFLCLPTPSESDGSIDLSIVEAGAAQLGEVLGEKDGWHTVVVKSTVVPTTTEEIVTPLLEEYSGKTAGSDFGVGMSPEFLREGSAVEDFLDPDKVVIGAADDRTRQEMRGVFDPLVERSGAPVVETGVREAEMIKYANNGFLAAKISLINDIGNVCKEYGVDSYEVAEAIGLDDRIGERFLRSGVGWGGSCFPKDVAALVAAAREQGYAPEMLEATVRVNDGQPDRLLSLVDRHVDVADRRVAVLGLAFKPGTDDIRNSRAIDVIRGLRERGADIVAYDPVAAANMREHFPDIEYADSAAAALRGAVAAAVVTGWDEFAALDGEFDQMERPVVVDGRRIVQPRKGLVYEGLTW
jgi:UDPglucose 6-dehydrogenase